jgi:hypothetical protein
MSSDAELIARWRAAWPQALETWSRYTQLSEPLLCDVQQAEAEQASDSIALIRFRDQQVLVNLEKIRFHHLEDFAVEILAHEVGHHVSVPGNLTNQARMIAALRSSLSGLDAEDWHLAANLYADLLINDRLQRTAGLRMAEIYRRMGREGDRLWMLYLRTYEELWRLPRGDLVADSDDELDSDAFLISRIVRHYAVRWLAGVRRFAAVIHPYLLKRRRSASSPLMVLRDLHRSASAGDRLDGLTTIGDEDGDDDLDAAFDEANGITPMGKRSAPTADAPGRVGGAGQQRDPFLFGETLRALGLDLDRNALVARWYRERAMPHLIPFPRTPAAPLSDPHPEGDAPWELGNDIEALDIVGTLSRHGILIPGITTVQRVEGLAPGREPLSGPIDLDIYIDCSGSMPDPAQNVSHLALAGTILTLSALRAGARVQATLWSGPRQFTTTKGFLRDESALLAVVCGYLCGSTAFPLHVLRDTYATRRPSDTPVHVVVISDDGVDTMLQQDEHGTAGADIVTTALARARAGGTLVLNLPNLETWQPKELLAKLGWHIHAVTDWEELITFARAFVREAYPLTVATAGRSRR